MILKKWPDSGQWEDADLDGVPCWIKMMGFPKEALTCKNVERLAQMAGRVLELNWNERKILLDGVCSFKNIISD